MSRVQCIDCGVAVVVDPSGFCPDGHLVGADGARIEAAIGVGVPYPDEPEPWVAKVEVPESEAGATPVQRTARPPGAPDVEPFHGASPAPAPAPGSAGPGAPAAAAPAASSNGAQAATDDLLRELHSLADLEDVGRDAPPHVSVRAPADADPPAAQAAGAAGAASHGPVGAATDSPHRDGLAELRALEAAVHALTGPNDDTAAAGTAAAVAGDGVVTHFPGPEQRTPPDAPDREQLAEVEELFARRPRPLTEAAPANRPSQAGPAPEGQAPRPAFQRTPWSSVPVDDVDSVPSTPLPPAAGSAPTTFPSAPAPTAPRGRRADQPAPGAGTDDALDLGNFTARGRRVGSRAEAKRRRKSR